MLKYSMLLLALEFRLFLAVKSYLNIQSLQIVQTIQFYLEVITLLTSTILDQGKKIFLCQGISIKDVLSNVYLPNGCKFVAVPVYGQRKCFRFAILDQRDMPDELSLTSPQYEDVTINEYNQAALNSGDPDRHITYEIVHGNYHFFPNTSKRRIDLVHLMHEYGNQTYCPVLR